MAQYGDSSNIIRPPFQRHTPPLNQANPGSTAGSKPEVPHNSSAPQSPRGGNLPTPAGDRSPTPKPIQSTPANLWIARRKNQWREQQLPSQPSINPPPSGESSGLPTAPGRDQRRSLNLPTAPTRSGTSAAREGQRPASIEQRLPMPPGRRLNNAPSGLAQSSQFSASPAPGTRPERTQQFGNKVTPLRPPTPLPNSQGSSPNAVPLRDRPSSRPRRKIKSAPMPVLYAIRLLIVGVGVAAIAGTLLSALQPQLNGSASSPTQEAAGGSGWVRLRGGQAATSVAAVTLTDEMASLKTSLDQLSALTPGLTQAVFALDLDTGHYVNLRGDSPVAAASTIKLPILVAFLQAVDAGKVSLDQVMVLQSQNIAAGSGDFQTQPPGTQYPAFKVATEMIINSDNTATNMMIDLLGGAAVLNQQFQAWGLTSTVVRNPLPDLTGTNTTSPRDLALLLALVDRGDFLSLRSRDRMLAIMQRTHNRSLIPAGIGEGSVVSNKTGDIASVLGDVALVDTPSGNRYVLATLVKRPDNDGRAGELIRRIADRVHKEITQASTPAATAPNPTTPVNQPGRVPGSAPTLPNQPMTAPSGDPTRAPTVNPQMSPSTQPGRGGDRMPQG